MDCSNNIKCSYDIYGGFTCSSNVVTEPFTGTCATGYSSVDNNKCCPKDSTYYKGSSTCQKCPASYNLVNEMCHPESAKPVVGAFDSKDAPSIAARLLPNKSYVCTNGPNSKTYDDFKNLNKLNNKCYSSTKCPDGKIYKKFKCISCPKGFEMNIKNDKCLKCVGLGVLNKTDSSCSNSNKALIKATIEKATIV
jgi:hypothetical protein